MCGTICVSMKHIVIVGGGFAGIRVARELRNVPGARITVISDQVDFRYSPALYRTATGGLRRVSAIALKTLVHAIPRAEFVHAKIVDIDRSKRRLKAQDGRVFNYDYCVMAMGVITSYFNIPGLKTFSYSIKSAYEVERLKRHLHQQLINEQAFDKNYVIVGAGPTGVELAAAFGQYLNKIAKSHRIPQKKVVIELIEAADRVLPTMSPKASLIAHKRLEKLGVKVVTKQAVKAATRNSLKVGARSIPTHTVIWTAGVTNNQFYKKNGEQFALDDRGRVVVDATLRVDKHLYVIGDNAAIKFGGLALTAIRQATYVAASLKGLIRYNRIPRPFKPTKPIYAVPLGNRNAVIEWHGLVFDGLLGGVLRGLADLIGYADIMGYPRAISLWLKRDEFEESCPVCRSPQVTP